MLLHRVPQELAKQPSSLPPPRGHGGDDRRTGTSSKARKDRQEMPSDNNGSRRCPELLRGLQGSIPLAAAGTNEGHGGIGA